MRNIVGIGAAGCAIADAFTVYPQYKVYKIDSASDEFQGSNYLKIKKRKTMESYEKSSLSLKKFFKPIKDDVSQSRSRSQIWFNIHN